MAIVNIGIPRRKDRGKTMSYTLGGGRTGSMLRSASQFEFTHVYGVETMEREGQKAITRHSAPGLRALKFTQLLGHNDYRRSIEPLVASLVYAGSSGQRIRFSYGSPEFENGRWWLIQGLNVKVAGRALDNSVSRVMLEWDLIEWVPVPNPSTSVRKPAPKPPTVVRGGTTSTKTPVARYYRVVRGDSLWSISARFLGNPLRWPEIFNMNRSIIRNANVLTPGMNLKLPAR